MKGETEMGRRKTKIEREEREKRERKQRV